MLMRKIIALSISIFALSGCSTSLRELDDLTLVTTKEVQAEKREEVQAMKAELSSVGAEKLSQEKNPEDLPPESVQTLSPKIIETEDQETA